METINVTEIQEPAFVRFLFANTKIAWLWLVVRLYVGWEWVHAALDKIHNPAWVGAHAGGAVKGFLMGALQKTAGPHPDVQGWYGHLIQTVAIPHAGFISNLVTYGEMAVGIALVLGIFTGIAAFFGTFMNLNYLFAGTVSLNPLLLLLQLFLILAWRVAGWYGVDRWLLPELGTPWHGGYLFHDPSHLPPKQ